MKIELTDNEVGLLKALIDYAVKAGGLQVAEQAVDVAKKLVPMKEADDGTKKGN